MSAFIRLLLIKIYSASLPHRRLHEYIWNPSFLLFDVALAAGDRGNETCTYVLVYKKILTYSYMCVREKESEKGSALIYSRQFMAELSFSPEQVN